MRTFYDELGVDPGATADELRRAYLQRARELHPDANATAPPAERRDAEQAMARVTEAWAVLGDPAARRRYDGTIGIGPAGGPRAPVTDLGDPLLGVPHRLRVRPSVVALIVLAVIFVATAYAGGPATDGDPPAAPGSDPRAVVDRGGTSPVGRCLVRQGGVDAFVQCAGEPGDQLVVLEVPPGEPCPSPLRRHQVLGRTQVVCLAS